MNEDRLRELYVTACARPTIACARPASCATPTRNAAQSIGHITLGRWRTVEFRNIQRGLTAPLGAAEFYAGLRQRYSERDGMCFLCPRMPSSTTACVWRRPRSSSCH